MASGDGTSIQSTWPERRAATRVDGAGDYSHAAASVYRGTVVLDGAWRNAGHPAGNNSGHAAQLAALPPGCAFAPRCRYVVDACGSGEIPVSMSDTGAMARCVRAVDTELA